ncbi:hypothetical protein HMPREF3101_06405 [Corynebacterium sp. HMSC29G08]|nr:hypothetical protein HMPREF3101_06405 [Corynebacterium sp. HMSC29G08]
MQHEPCNQYGKADGRVDQRDDGTAVDHADLGKPAIGCGSAASEDGQEVTKRARDDLREPGGEGDNEEVWRQVHRAEGKRCGVGEHGAEQPERAGGDAECGC